MHYIVRRGWSWPRGAIASGLISVLVASPVAAQGTAAQIDRAPAPVPASAPETEAEPVTETESVAAPETVTVTGTASEPASASAPEAESELEPPSASKSDPASASASASVAEPVAGTQRLVGSDLDADGGDGEDSRLWPTLAAAGPGLVVHGTGHLVAGETRTGLRLLWLQGIGAAAAVTGLAGLAITGTSPKFVLPFIGIGTAGGALFIASALADIYGVAAPAGGLGTPVSQPALVIEAGPRLVDDPIFEYDHFAYASVSAWVARVRIEGSGWVGVDHDNLRLRLLGAYRLVRFDEGTYIDLELAAMHHRFAPELFSMTFFELALSGRLGLEVIGDTLEGSFFDYALGYALGSNRQFGIATESDEMTLARFGYGFYMGTGGELSVYYDHRHDDFAAGLKMPGLGSGPLGHVGLEGSYYFADAWGASAFAETGSAHVLGLSLLHRRRSW